MTVELIERCCLGRRPDLPSAGATPQEWSDHSEAIGEWRRGFDERWNGFFEEPPTVKLKHAFRRDIWDRGNACWVSAGPTMGEGLQRQPRCRTHPGLA